MSPQAERTLDVSALVHSKERTYLGVVASVSIVAYGIALVAIFSASSAAPQVIGVFVFYAIVGVLAYAIGRGLALGHLVGNGVRVSQQQLPHLYRMAEATAARVGMTTLPDIYLVQAGGLLNAFATRFFGREFVVLYSDIIDIAGEHGDEAVGFVIAHELAHHHRGHLAKHLWLFPGRVVPFLGAAYSRGCELTCDRYGAACYPGGAVAGLLALAAGTRTHQQLDADVFAEQVTTEAGFWRSVAEVLGSHPILPRRVLELTSAGMVARQGVRVEVRV